MLCKICGTEETDNPDGICDDCKFCIIGNKESSTIYFITFPFLI